jgi:hypothetical protein
VNIKKTLFWSLSITLALLVIASEGYLFWRVKKLEEFSKDQRWKLALHTDLDVYDPIQPTVGTIQFLKSGFSIQLETVKYTGEGLNLKGFVGNPKYLTLYSVTLVTRVFKDPSTARDSYMKTMNPSGVFEFFFIDNELLGTGQSSPISRIAPGTREPFEITVPNVKQTKDPVVISMRMSGERYSLGLAF